MLPSDEAVVQSGYVSLPCGASAFISRPSVPSSRGVVVLPSMYGTTSTFEQLGAELAATHGWTTCLPEIITEEPNAEFATRRAVVSGLVDQDIFAILDEAATATAAPTVALLGFCIGGMYAIKATAMHRFDRIVAFYGMVRIPSYWLGDGQGEPLTHLPHDEDGLLAIFGERDEFIPVADIDALEARGVPVVRYPEAGHAFAHDPGNPHYRRDDSDDAWRRALSFVVGGTHA